MRTEEGSDPNASWTAIVGVIGAILIVAFIVAIQTLYFTANDQELSKKAATEAAEELNLMVSEQTAELEDYRWVDKEQGKVAVPIDRAIELVIAEEQPASGSVNVPGGGATDQ